MQLIYADFNNQDEAHHIRLNLRKSCEGLGLLGDRLQEGMVAWLADEEGRVQATLHHRAGIWVGVPDWDTWEETPFEITAGTSAKP